MAQMTDEKTDVQDGFPTRTTTKQGFYGTGFFSGRGYRMIALDEETAHILNSRSMATRQSPSEIVSELVHGRLVTAM